MIEVDSRFRGNDGKRGGNDERREGMTAGVGE